MFRNFSMSPFQLYQKHLKLWVSSRIALALPWWETLDNSCRVTCCWFVSVLLPTRCPQHRSRTQTMPLMQPQNASGQAWPKDCKMEFAAMQTVQKHTDMHQMYGTRSRAKLSMQRNHAWFFNKACNPLSTTLMTWSLGGICTTEFCIENNVKIRTTQAHQSRTSNTKWLPRYSTLSRPLGTRNFSVDTRKSRVQGLKAFGNRGANITEI